MRSMGVRRVVEAGTKHPIWAIMTARQLVRRIVDLPDALAPVRRLILAVSPPSLISLGMKSGIFGRMQGYRRFWNSMTVRSSSTNVGRQASSPRAEDTLAREMRQLRWATILTAASQVS